MKLLTLLFALVVSQFSHAEIVKKFMADNDLARFDDMEERNVTQSQFDTALNQLQAFYGPMVRTLYGANLVIIHDWGNPTVNAYSTRQGNTWILHMYGGLARRPEITVDGFQIVGCHEFGHQTAGFPFFTDGQWPSDEGQSDYFATLSCARQLWHGQTVENLRAAVEIPAYPKALCDASWPLQPDRNLCYRAALAGKSLADLLSGGTAQFETPDESTVETTNHEHPAGQCRLDTYLAGAICVAAFDSHMIPQTEMQSVRYTCTESQLQVGFRPKCWFKATL